MRTDHLHNAEQLQKSLGSTDTLTYSSIHLEKKVTFPSEFDAVKIFSGRCRSYAIIPSSVENHALSE